MSDPTMFSNGLCPAEDERLSLVLEEMGEAIQVIGKIMRHGYKSYDPTKVAMSPTNRELLEMELGHVRHAIDRLALSGDVNVLAISGAMKEKADRVGRWLHHQGKP